ncbi:alpha-L-fucosidase [Dyadobacter subterraneus]|nr:alpha-L-fucosidase [Dyadobacter subterraneus]
MKCYTILVCLCVIGNCFGQVKAPEPVGPTPTENQVRWQEMEYYAFIHFSTNTFTDQEWGYGEANDAKLFNPTNLDCDQWARVCKNSGMKGIIVTAKHHSGFCLWPTETTEYSIKNSPWKDGKGDIIGDLAKACKKYGLKLGIYISPWDRNNPSYGLLDPDGSAPYVKNVFRKQIEECLTKYGDVFEIWFDGANGGDGYYGGARTSRKIDRTTYYDWANTYKMIRKIQPKIVIWNDNGDRADLRWVGTESGYVGETNWSLLNAKGDVPHDMLAHGVENGDSWVPGEVNTSIRPGWFYHEYEDNRVKTLPELLKVYYSSFGRNGTMLLNFPIDKTGRIHKTDEKAALELAGAVKEAFAMDLAKEMKVSASNIRGKSSEFGADKALDGDKNTYWATDDAVKTASLIIDFGAPKAFNRFLAQEYIQLGQRVKSFTIEAFVNGKWKQLDNQTTIGYKRILAFPTVKASQLRFTITDSKASPVISNVSVYNAPQILEIPLVTRAKSGEVTITATDKESQIFYTLDGSMPTKKSKLYTQTIAAENKVSVRAIACDPVSGKSSPVGEEHFDISHKNWKIVGIEDEKVNNIIDGNRNTDWFQPQNNKLPASIVIDLGKQQNLAGFKYLPSQSRNAGIITRYQFLVSSDNKQWNVADEGEFSNIKNNPLWQIKKFTPVKGRYIKLVATHNTQENNAAGYAEIDVITN